MTNLRILLLATTALTATQLATSASHAQTAPIVVAQAKEETGPGGRPRRRRRVPRRRLPRRRRPRRLLRHPRPRHLRVRSPAAATACCGSAAASSATPAASGGSTTPAPDAAAASPGCRAEGTDSASAAPCGCTFAPNGTAASSAGSRACGAEATCRTDDATTAAAFVSESDAITCTAAAPAGWHQAAAGACHHAGSDSAADSRPSAWRKYDDGATAGTTGSTDDASECGRPDNHADHTARDDPARRLRLRRAELLRRPRPLRRQRAPRRVPAPPSLRVQRRRRLLPRLREARPPRRQPPCRVRQTPRHRPAGHKTPRRPSRRPSARRLRLPHRCQQPRRRTLGLRVIAPGAPRSGPQRLDDFRGQRRESQQGGRTIITEPGRIIIRDPGGQQYVRHNEVDRFRYGARDIQTQTVGGETRTVVIRPDGTQVITVVGRDGQLMRRIRRDQRGREIIIIDNSYRGPGGGGGGFYVALAPPVVRIPYNRYIVDSEEASPEVLYETMMAPPVERIERRYSLDEIRYSPTVRQRMPSIDVNTINFELGSWEVPPDQAAKLQAIADGLNRAIQENPRAVFLIEGHTDAVGNDVDNLSLSDRRAESAATLLTQQFNVPAENLTSQGYGEQYLKEAIDGPSPINRRVTIRNITPLLNGGQASLPPPPPGTAPPRR